VLTRAIVDIFTMVTGDMYLAYPSRRHHTRLAVRPMRTRGQQTREFPPPTWQLQPPDPNWLGRRFASPGGEAWLAFYASPADQETVSAHFKTLAFADGEEIVTLHAGRDQLIVTGAKGDRVFYRKARLACDGRQWHHVALEFPFSTEPRQARSYELLVAQAARALDSADDDGCIAPTAENPPRDD
jgi:hypothetical protein